MSDLLVGYFTASKQTNQFTITSHGLLNGDTVRFALGATGNTLPTPIVEGTWYYVVGAASDTFQVSATSGGVAIVLNDAGTGSNEAWSPAPTTPVWTYEMVGSEIRAPEYMPDMTEVNLYAERGWELLFMGQIQSERAGGSRFWYLVRKQN